jgi:hypothetical protein
MRQHIKALRMLRFWDFVHIPRLEVAGEGAGGAARMSEGEEWQRTGREDQQRTGIGGGSGGDDILDMGSSE